MATPPPYWGGSYAGTGWNLVIPEAIAVGFAGEENTLLA